MVEQLKETYVGRDVPIVDGYEKVSGHLRFIGDLKLSGMLHAQLITSDFAHANILSIDTEAALAIPGVVAVLTADDLPDITPSSRTRMLLARGRVIFYGQPVALVIAENEYAAADGAEQVFVDYEQLPVAISLDDAMADDAPLVWTEGVPGGSNDAGAHGADVASSEKASKRAHSNIIDESLYERGDIHEGFEQADVIVEHTFSTAIVHQSYIEPQGVIAQPDPVTRGMTIWSNTQAPFDIRNEIAEVLGMMSSDVRVIPTSVGGGFGGKFGLYELLIALVAQKLNKPVRLILSRMNELASTTPAPLMRVQARMGADKEGNLTALEADVILDSGCYPSWLSSFATFALGTQYRIPNFVLKGTDIVSFKPSVGAYRAPTAPIVIFVLDTLIDEIAEKLNLDSVDVRLINCIQGGDKLPDDRLMPTIGMRETLEAIKKHPLWQNREESRRQGRGVGFAVGGWMGAIEPGAAVCKLERDGTVQVHLGIVDLSGVTTTFSLLAADAFGVSPEQVRIIYSDTATAPYGGATGGSKTTYSMTGAIIEAAQSARKQTLEIASEEFEASPEDLEIVNGNVRVKGFPDKTLSLADIAGKTMQYAGKYGPVFAHGRSAMRNSAPGFNAQIVEVELDRETGVVTILNHVAIQDVGKALNPAAIKGQMAGGAMQGLGWALYEQLVYDDSGQLLSGSLLDYNIPKARHSANQFEAIILEIPSDEGYAGIRSVGEPPVVSTAAAVANAIADATGVRMTTLPMTPPRVYAALKE